MSVYTRMSKLVTNKSIGEKLEIIFTAANNLVLEDEILEFAKEYKLLHPIDYKYEIQYVLSFYPISYKSLWKKALMDFIFIDELLTRSETELYAYVEYVDKEYRPIDELNTYTNKEKGMHQDILKVGPDA